MNSRETYEGIVLRMHALKHAMDAEGVPTTFANMREWRVDLGF